MSGLAGFADWCISSNFTEGDVLHTVILGIFWNSIAEVLNNTSGIGIFQIKYSRKFSLHS